MFFDFYLIYVKMFCYFKQDFINDGIQMTGTNFFAPDILSGTPVSGCDWFIISLIVNEFEIRILKTDKS